MKSWLITALALLPLILAADPYEFDNPETLPDRQTMVHLFEWKWTDVAKECENFLQHYGYGAVQVSPPNEHIMIYKDNDVPWFVRYQPVSYRLNSRSGNAAEFQDMVNRCNKVGVRIIVDAVLNHMVGVGQKSSDPGRGSSGGANFDGSDGVERFPAVPFNNEDFHDYACHGDIQGDDYQHNANNVRNCRLVGLLDLNHKSSFVRTMIKNYLNTLISNGVAGFRLDASKHMFPEDLRAILEGVDNLRSDIFGSGQRPFVVHEVIDRGGEAITVGEYVTIGRYTNFNFGAAVAQAIWRNTDVADLAKLGPGYGYGNLEDHDVLNFIDNHDNQRDQNPYVLTYKTGDSYRLGMSYMLAWTYGFPRVMSSFRFSSHDQGPPNEGSGSNYKTRSPSFNPDETCNTDSGWECEHRWPTIRQMAKFRQACSGKAATEIVTDRHRLAFAREGAGFFALNNNDGDWERDFSTTLPAGSYCDQYNGALTGSSCTGTKIDVPSSDNVHIRVPARQAIAISLASRIGGAPDVPVTDYIGDLKKTVIFVKKATSPEQNVFIRGGTAQAHQCAPGPFGQPQDPCAIRIVHNSTVPWMFAEYKSWSQGDSYLDFEGEERRQGTHDGVHASGTPLAYSTNDASAIEYQPLNKYGPGYWFVQLLMDCSKTESGWFEFKGYLDGWEQDVSQSTCSGPLGGNPPIRNSPNHIAKCGGVSVFEWGSGSCRVDNF